MFGRIVEAGAVRGSEGDAGHSLAIAPQTAMVPYRFVRGNMVSKTSPPTLSKKTSA
jgi:hypothetical protein